MRKLPPELEDLAEQIGQFIEYWGFKKIHGRIWTHLYLSKDPLDATELRERLKVSKALISMSLADLLEYEVIQELGKGPRGTLVYRANPDVTQVILGVIRKRERKMISQIQAAHRLVADLKPEDQRAVLLDADRIQSLGTMIQGAQGALEALMAVGPIDADLVRQFTGLSSE